MTEGGGCPATVKVKWFDGKKYRVENTKRRCGRPLSEDYAHCNSHITDREFFARKEREMPTEQIQSLARQIVGVEKAMAKGKELKPQHEALRKKFGLLVGELDNQGDRMNAHKFIKQLRVKNGIDVSDTEFTPTTVTVTVPETVIDVPVAETEEELVTA